MRQGCGQRVNGMPDNMNDRLTLHRLYLFIYALACGILLTLAPFRFSVTNTTEIEWSYDFFLLDSIGNILLFLPIGFTGAMLFRATSSKALTAVVILLSVCISLAIEIAQSKLGRTSSAADILFNSLGGATGAFLYIGFASNRNTVTVNSQLRKMFHCLAIVLYILLLLLLLFLPIHKSADLSIWSPNVSLTYASRSDGSKPWLGDLYHSSFSLVREQQAQPDHSSPNFLTDLSNFNFAEFKYNAVASNDGRQHARLVFENPDSVVATKDGGVRVLRETRAYAKISKRYIQGIVNNIYSGFELSISLRPLTESSSTIVAFGWKNSVSNFRLDQSNQRLVFRVGTPLTGEAARRFALTSSPSIHAGKKYDVSVSLIDGTMSMTVNGESSSKDLSAESITLYECILDELQLWRLENSIWFLLFVPFLLIFMPVHKILSKREAKSKSSSRVSRYYPGLTALVFSSTLLAVLLKFFSHGELFSAGRTLVLVGSLACAYFAAYCVTQLRGTH